MTEQNFLSKSTYGCIYGAAPRALSLRGLTGNGEAFHCEKRNAV